MNTYGEIYSAFEPIFQWIQKNYPSGGFFIVDSDSAKFYCGNSEISVFSERIKAPLTDNEEFKEAAKNVAKTVADVLTKYAENDEDVSRESG